MTGTKETNIPIGGDGHCKLYIDVIEQHGRFSIAGIVDILERLHEKVLGYEIIGTDGDLPLMSKQYSNFLITIGRIRSACKRIILFNRLLELGTRSFLDRSRLPSLLRIVDENIV